MTPEAPVLPPMPDALRALREEVAANRPAKRGPFDYGGRRGQRRQLVMRWREIERPKRDREKRRGRRAQFARVSAASHTMAPHSIAIEAMVSKIRLVDGKTDADVKAACRKLKNRDKRKRRALRAAR